MGSQKPIALIQLDNFWHGNVQPEGQGDDFVQDTAAPGQGISSGLHIFPGSLPRSISEEQRPSSQTGRGVVGQGRLYRERAGGALHAEEVSNTQKEILQGGELNTKKQCSSAYLCC